MEGAVLGVAFERPPRLADRLTQEAEIEEEARPHEMVTELARYLLLLELLEGREQFLFFVI